MFLYQTNTLLKIIYFTLIKQLNNLNTSYEFFGPVAELSYTGLQRPYTNRLFPYKHCIIHHQIVQILSMVTPAETRF